MIRYIDVCSGISAPTMAWKPLGWEALCFAEIEAAPRAILAHHYPQVPLNGDFTKIKGDEYGPVDLLVGGTPCQSFSIAGLRGGLADERGNLALEFLRLADRARPRWLVWENVPGVLSSSGGRDFGAFLGGLGQLGYGFAYRVLDAQHFGVPQRRRRVFVVGYLGDWRRAAAVLFERHSLSGRPAPRREKGPSVGALTANGVGTCGADDNQGQAGHLVASTGGIAHCLNAGGMGRQDYETETLIAQAVPVAFGWQNSPSQGDSASEDCTPTLDKSKRAEIRLSAATDALACGGGKPGQGYAATFTGTAVRRLTPRECERLQGFPEVQKSYTILLCRDYSDQQKSHALAALQCRKLQSNAWTADASGWKLSAEAAAHHSSTSPASHAPPVALDVLIDLERQEVRLHSAGRSFSLVSSADARSEFPLPTGIDGFAHLAALLTQTWALAMRDGKVASPASITPSTRHWNGSSIALGCGREIEEGVAAASESIALASHFTTSTTSPSGLDTQTFASTLRTLSCCVAHAIAGCIPEETRAASSFAVRLTSTQGFTLIPYRGKPAADGPRYKALGNSMAVPVLRWIGERIAKVDAIPLAREIAA